MRVKVALMMAASSALGRGGDGSNVASRTWKRCGFQMKTEALRLPDGRGSVAASKWRRKPCGFQTDVEDAQRRGETPEEEEQGRARSPLSPPRLPEHHYPGRAEVGEQGGPGALSRSLGPALRANIPEQFRTDFKFDHRYPKLRPTSPKMY